eukprot:984632_1
MALLPLYLAFIVVSGQYSYSWTKISDPPLPTGNRLYAVAQYNETIWLVGGGETTDLVSFDIIDETFTDLAWSSVGTAWGWGDYATQIGHIMYWIYPNAPRLHRFNCRTASYSSWLSTPFDAYSKGCLAGDVTNNRLFLVGGGNTALNNVSFLNLATSDWTTAPVMNWARREHSCIVDPVTSKLFAIGSTGTGTIEYIDVNTLDQWILNAQALPRNIYQSKAVIHPLTGFIYLIGGFCGNYCTVNFFYTI